MDKMNVLVFNVDPFGLMEAHEAIHLPEIKASIFLLGRALASWKSETLSREKASNHERIDVVMAAQFMWDAAAGMTDKIGENGFAPIAGASLRFDDGGFSFAHPAWSICFQEDNNRKGQFVAAVVRPEDANAWREWLETLMTAKTMAVAASAEGTTLELVE